MFVSWNKKQHLKLRLKSENLRFSDNHSFCIKVSRKLFIIVYTSATQVNTEMYRNMECLI